VSELQSAISVLRVARGELDTELQRIAAEADLDPMDRTPFPILCCMCQFRGEDHTEVDLFLSSIFDGYSCHHPIVGNSPGTQDTVRQWKDCQAFRKRVRI
jgi:hypothetical protein